MFKYYGKTAPYLFLLPAALVLIIFFFIPFFQSILLSFQDYSTNIYHATFTGLKNYVDILHNPIFYKVMWNTVLYLIVAVPILAIVPLFLAILTTALAAEIGSSEYAKAVGPTIKSEIASQGVPARANFAKRFLATR